jgi:putative membrane protein
MRVEANPSPPTSSHVAAIADILPAGCADTPETHSRTSIMTRGFLGYDASFMLDVVVCALVAVVPVLLWSLYEVKVRHRYTAHRNLQVMLAAVLLVAVLLFEIDMRLQGGWQNIINRDPAKPRLTGAALDDVRTILYIHLFFAVSTPVLWAATLIHAFRRFANPPVPGPASHLHKKLGWLSMLDLVMTSITGLAFYYMAFVRPAG